MSTKKHYSTPSIKKVVWTSFAVDVSDIALNLAVAILSGSITIAAQTLKGTADLLTSVLLLIGVRRSKKLANRRYQFGYGRELFFWALASAVFMLLVTGALAFYYGLQRFFEPQTVTRLGLAYTVLLISLFTNFRALWLSWQRLNGRIHGSFWHRFYHSGLIETKTTLVKDLMGTVAAVGGLVALIFLQVFNNFKLDGLGAMLIGGVTGILAVFLIKDAKDLLVGKAASAEIEKQVKAAALMIKGVESVLDLRTMYLGSAKILVNIEVHLKHGLKTREIEKIMDAIKEQIKASVPAVHHIQVELETPDDTTHAK